MAVLGTSRVIRKVLQSETGSLSEEVSGEKKGLRLETTTTTT